MCWFGKNQGDDSGIAVVQGAPEGNRRLGDVLVGENEDDDSGIAAAPEGSKGLRGDSEAQGGDEPDGACRA